MSDATLDLAEDTKSKDVSQRQETGGVKLVISASVASALISLLTTLITAKASSPDADRIADRVRADVMKEAAQQFVVKGIDDTRWTYYTKGVDERLQGIAEKLDSIDRRTADLPRMAAKLELIERQK